LSCRHEDSARRREAINALTAGHVSDSNNSNAYAIKPAIIVI
jgi:hypothetical protein